MIAFKKDTELSVVIRFDENADTIAEQANEIFKAGEKVDADIVDVDESGNYVTLQYADGTVSLSVLRASFDILLSPIQ